jgi:hypothetical protein
MSTSPGPRDRRVRYGGPDRGRRDTPSETLACQLIRLLGDRRRRARRRCLGREVQARDGSERRYGRAGRRRRHPGHVRRDRERRRSSGGVGDGGEAAVSVIHAAVIVSVDRDRVGADRARDDGNVDQLAVLGAQYVSDAHLVLGCRGMGDREQRHQQDGQLAVCRRERSTVFGGACHELRPSSAKRDFGASAGSSPVVARAPRCNRLAPDISQRLPQFSTHTDVAYESRAP